MSKRAIITGITGQDGSYLAELLLDKGYEVVGVVRRSSAPNYWRIEHLLPRLQLRLGDLLDQLSLVLAAIDQLQDGMISLQLRGTLGGGGAFGPVPISLVIPKLVRYTKTNRRGVRDVADCTSLRNPTRDSDKWKAPPFPCGGDSWARPSAKRFAEGVTDVVWNDFSNMNGGRFPPHSSHRTGIDIDGSYEGYLPRRTAAALKMIQLLNLSGRKVDAVFVTFNNADVAVNKDPFWLAIKDVTLTDGRRARDVITPEPDHADHFHWRLDPSRLQ